MRPRPRRSLVRAALATPILAAALLIAAGSGGCDDEPGDGPACRTHDARAPFVCACDGDVRPFQGCEGGFCLTETSCQNTCRDRTLGP